jgi:hypothetical protein
MTPNRALEAALALWRAPRLARMMRSQPLPDGVTLILQILSGDINSLAEAQSLTRLEDNDIIGVAELYVFRVMLYRGASPYRVLGAEVGAERTQLRRNMGYLMNWLHPDKTASNWRAVFAHRVLDAWHQVDKGIAEEGTGLRVVAGSRRSFLVPWISAPPERVARTGFVSLWRNRLRLWRVGFIFVSGFLASDGLSGYWASSGSDTLAATASPHGSSRLEDGRMTRTHD